MPDHGEPPMTPAPSQPERVTPVEIVADFTADILGRYLAHDEATPRLEARVAPFGQVIQTLLTSVADADADTRPPVSIVWTQPQAVIESFARVLAHEPVATATLLAEVDRFADAVARHRRHRRAVLVVDWTIPAWRHGWGMLDFQPGLGLRHALLAMNLRLAERLAECDGCFLLASEAWLRAAGRHATDPKAWFVTKVPFANAVFQSAVPAIKAAVAGLNGGARKLVIVDLDDTLWGGIVGDVGWQGVTLGGHDPTGEAFVAFQHALLALTRRGVQLAIVSKNEEAVALEAIDRHPEMVLRREHFAGWRINWDDKARNVAELVRELSLGFDAVVFVDDNPVERARVAEMFPDVLVPDWSRDPARSAATLSALACFDQPTVSDEDRSRTAMYTAERARKASRDAEASLDDWLASLDLRVTAKPLDDVDLPRTAQLLNKTNQMNLTTRRLTAAEFAAWANAEGNTVWTVRVADRFGDAGLTGILGLAQAGGTAKVIDFVLSCRVMGRRVEEALVALAHRWAHARGLDTIEARFCPTERNRPCLRFWRGARGFVAAPDGEATRFVASVAPNAAYPPGVTVTVDGLAFDDTERAS